MVDRGCLQLHVADHVPAARARQFREALAAAGAAPADSAPALRVLLALCLDAALVAQAGALLARHPAPLLLALGDPAAAQPAGAIDALFRLGLWNVAIESEDARLAASAAACLEPMREVEAALASDRVRRNLVGASAAWRALLRETVWAARFSAAPILLLGETGTGKELLARLIHTTDARPDKGDLVVVDCTTLTGELAGSELFGHQRGAYTGAHAQRAGAAQLADGGTLFLDEVGELHLAVQAQLLRLLQEGMYKPVGASSWQRSSFRLVCATHRDLGEAVRAGRFREDLYFRLAGWVARVPSLRERAGDVPGLAAHFLAEFGCPQGPDETLVQALQGHAFPGNVRELRQLMQQATVKHCGPGRVSLGDLPASWHARAASAQAAAPAPQPPSVEDGIAAWVRAGAGLRDVTQRAGDIAIREALLAEGNHVGRAARRLGVTQRAIQLRKAQRPPAPRAAAG